MMTEDDRQKGLRRVREATEAKHAREALDIGNAAEALSIIERALEYNAQNLISLLSIICFQNRDQRLVQKATRLFYRDLNLCMNFKLLIPPMQWIQNPKRTRSVPPRLIDAIKARRRNIEPSWNGTWENPGANEKNTVLAKRPEDVTDPIECLHAAAQTSLWKMWHKRYVELGGDVENPLYLKIWVSKGIERDTEPTPRIKGLLEKFTLLAGVGEVRKFLRNITPIRNGSEGKTPNQRIATWALLLYCQCDRLDHTADDWVHIAQSAVYLDHLLVARITYRILFDLEKTFVIEEVLDLLALKTGRIVPTRSAKSDIGLHNPVLHDVFQLLPDDATSSAILSAYARKTLTLE